MPWKAQKEASLCSVCHLAAGGWVLREPMLWQVFFFSIIKQLLLLFNFCFFTCFSFFLQYLLLDLNMESFDYLNNTLQHLFSAVYYGS